MSNYSTTLRERLERLEAAQENISNAYDQYMDPADEADLQEAMELIDQAKDSTQSELDVIQADWELVEDHADEIIQMADEVATEMANKGLIEYEDWGVRQALNPEPGIIEETRRFLDRIFTDWHEVRTSASDMQEGI